MNTDKRKIRYHYHLVRFIPFPETEEFANVGVILVETESRRMEYRLATDLPDRVAQFFPGLSLSLYENALAQFQQWCEQLRQGAQAGRASARHTASLIEEVGNRQLPLVRVGPRRTKLGSDNAALMTEGLYQEYVDQGGQKADLAQEAGA